MIEAFEEIGKREIRNIMLHSQLCDYFDFLGLKGFSKWTEYKYYEESKTWRELHKFVLKNYDEILNDDEAEFENLIPKDWYGKKKESLTNQDRKASVKEAFAKWLKWEEETKDLIESQCEKVKGDIVAKEKIKELTKDVAQELNDLKARILEYKIIDYDMTYISDRQQELYDEYSDELEDLEF